MSLFNRVFVTVAGFYIDGGNNDQLYAVVEYQIVKPDGTILPCNGTSNIPVAYTDLSLTFQLKVISQIKTENNDNSLLFTFI